MICPKGSLCSESTHEVKTLSVAQQWFNDVIESQLPITVNTFNGEGGRLRISVFDCDNNLIHRRG